MKYPRRSTRKIESLPSLFDETDLTRVLDAGMNEAKDSGEKSSLEVEREMSLSEEFRKPLKQIRFMSFGSGSSGNCSYIGTAECGLLIDAGVDNNFVLSEMARNGINPATIRGILLTHDHGDHVRYAYALVRRHPGWHLYATPRTVEGVLRRHNLSRRIRDYHSPIYKEHEYTFGDMVVVPFETSHDGSDNVGFAITCGSKVFVIATDTGYINERADFYLRKATSMMIEANYDEAMLTHGRYPEFLKARIRSTTGHMDNAETARYIAETYRTGISHILLCHLSDDNNSPETALNTVTDALRGNGVDIASSSGQISAGNVYVATLPRYKSSELFIL